MRASSRRRTARTIPLSEINLNTVRKKAVTNAQSRAVKASWPWRSHLEGGRDAGVRKDGLAPVNYTKPKAAPNGKQTTERDLAEDRLSNMLFDLASFEDAPLDVS